MTLRQSLLSFAGSVRSTQASKPSHSSKSRPTPSRTATSSTDLEDTIVVESPERPAQLPTPSESATDVSSQGTDILSVKDVPKRRAKRVSRSARKNRSEACLLESAEDEQNKDRAVSGETLVNNANMSQSSLMEKSINLLNLPRQMSEVFDQGSKAELVRHSGEDPSASTDIVVTLTPKENDEEDDEERREKAAAKRAKMEENKKLREQKWKAEDKKATRRSSRASMFTKAGDMVSDLASSVLGKRKDRVVELRGTVRPRSAVEPLSGDDSAFAPDAKRRRLSDTAVPTTAKETSVASIRRTIRPPREKKWLNSGLYAGQPRSFNPKVSESKNKRKSTSAASILSHKENTVLPLPMFAGERLIKQGRDFKLPFDVFSPLPAGQPKPDEWRKSNKNTFVGDASQEWRISKFIEHSTCMCKPNTGCDQDCMNRFMYYECDERNCILTADQCGNRAFEGLRQRVKKGGKYNVGVEVIKTADRGHGVRANRTFEPDQIIVEYSGEIVTQEECEGRMHKEYKENECYYLMLFDQNMIIDATTRGSIARFVNHSCNPNCRMEKWTVGGQPRMALFAGDRGIMTGEELTYDYNFDPYSLKNVQVCRCGEKGCRGVLGPKSKEEKEKKAKDEEGAGKEGKLKGVKRKIVEVVEERLPSKKQKITTKEVKTTSKSPRGSVSPRKSGSGKVKLMKKGIRRSSAPVALERKPSKLKRMLSGAKSRASVAKERAAGRRVASAASAREGLLEKDKDNENDAGSAKGKGKGTVSRGASLKAKVGRLGVAGRSTRR